MRIILALLILAATAVSCHRSGNRHLEPIAKVYNTYLYRGDLSSVIPTGISPADSTRIAQRYIDMWIRNQLLLRLAEMNLPADEKNVEKQVASYRASLLIHKYQQYLIGQKLDTIISPDEINDYYHENISNFILERPAIRGIYLKIPLSSPNRDRILPWFRNENDLIFIENYADHYAESSMWFSDDWVYLNDILHALPDGSFDASRGMSGRDHILVTDSEYMYFIGINEYLAPRNQMPVSLAAEKIKSIILNRRKTKFLNDLEKNIINESTIRNTVQYF